MASDHQLRLSTHCLLPAGCTSSRLSFCPTPTTTTSVVRCLPDPIGFEFVISDKTYWYREWTRFDREIMRYGILP